MSYPHWPEALDQFERPAWSATYQDSRRRKQSDAGPPAFRRRFSSAAKRVSLSLVVDRYGKVLFDEFFEQDCAHGSRLFWMPDPVTDGWPLLTGGLDRLLTIDGRPLLVSRRWLCAWGDEPPVEAITGDVEFRLSFSVWVMP